MENQFILTILAKFMVWIYILYDIRMPIAHIVVYHCYTYFRLFIGFIGDYT